MSSFRIGNDLAIQWSIYIQEGEQSVPYNLEGKDITLIAEVGQHSVDMDSISVEGNVVSISFLGKSQVYKGSYTFTLIENYGKVGMITLDYCNAFSLVARSCLAKPETECSRLEISTVELSSALCATQTVGGGAVVYDSSMSETSTNAVQNRVITAALNDLKTELNNTINEAIASAITNTLNT